jgi:hypothetical protein
MPIYMGTISHISLAAHTSVADVLTPTTLAGSLLRLFLLECADKP